MEGHGIYSVATGEWKKFEELADKTKNSLETKEDILRLRDWTTGQIDILWPQISQARFQELDTAFGQYEGPVWSHIGPALKRLVW